MPGTTGIIVAKPISPIVTVPAKLRLAGLGFESAVIGSKAKIPPVDVRRFSSFHGTNHTAAFAIRSIEPIVEPIFESVSAMLLVAFAKAREKGHARISLAVAIRVLGVKYIRRRADDH